MVRSADPRAVTRSDLCERLLAQSRLSRRVVKLVVETMIEHIVDTLASGERIELRGFGSFSLRYRAAQVRRDPRTGEPISVPGKYTVHFRAGEQLRERVNRSDREKGTAAVKRGC